MALANSLVSGWGASTHQTLNPFQASKVTFPRWLSQHLRSSTQQLKLVVTSGGGGGGGGGGKRCIQIMAVVGGQK